MTSRYYFDCAVGESLALLAEREGSKKMKRFALTVAGRRAGIFWRRWMADLQRRCSGDRLGERVTDWVHWGSILPPSQDHPQTICPYTSGGPAASARDGCAHVYHFVSLSWLSHQLGVSRKMGDTTTIHLPTYVDMHMFAIRRR